MILWKLDVLLGARMQIEVFIVRLHNCFLRLNVKISLSNCFHLCTSKFEAKKEKWFVYLLYLLYFLK